MKKIKNKKNKNPKKPKKTNPSEWYNHNYILSIALYMFWGKQLEKKQRTNIKTKKKGS